MVRCSFKILFKQNLASFFTVRFLSLAHVIKVTNHPCFCKTVEFPGMKDFPCENWKSLGQIGAS